MQQILIGHMMPIDHTYLKFINCNTIWMSMRMLTASVSMVRGIAMGTEDK